MKSKKDDFINAKSSVGVENFKDIPITTPNITLNKRGFYISYNSVDSGIYGDVTTALVHEKHLNFFILLGDHRKQYAELVDKGFDACFKYFQDNKSLIAPHSEVRIAPYPESLKEKK